MTSPEDTDEISFDGFREWLPVPTEDVDDDVYVSELLALYRTDPAGPRVIEGMARQFIDLGQQLAEQSDDEFRVLGAWSLLAPGGERLILRGLATFGAQRIRPGSTLGEVLEQMFNEVDLYQPPLVETIDTASGPAGLARIRRHVGRPPEMQISEIVVVVWISAELDIAYVLSSLPMDDLLEAADYAEAVVPLAASARGLV